MKNKKLVEYILNDKSNLRVHGDIRTGLTSVLKEVIVQAQIDMRFTRIITISEEHGFRSLGRYNGLVKYDDAGLGLDYTLMRVVEGDNVMLVIDDADIAVHNSVVADKLVALARGHKCKILIGMHKNYIDVPLLSAIHAECSNTIELIRTEDGFFYEIDGSLETLELYRC